MDLTRSYQDALAHPPGDEEPDGEPHHAEDQRPQPVTPLHCDLVPGVLEPLIAVGAHRVPDAVAGVVAERPGREPDDDARHPHGPGIERLHELVDPGVEPGVLPEHRVPGHREQILDVLEPQLEHVERSFRNSRWWRRSSGRRGSCRRAA